MLTRELCAFSTELFHNNKITTNNVLGMCLAVAVVFCCSTNYESYKQNSTKYSMFVCAVRIVKCGKRALYTGRLSENGAGMEAKVR